MRCADLTSMSSPEQSRRMRCRCARADLVQSSCRTFRYLQLKIDEQCERTTSRHCCAVPCITLVTPRPHVLRRHATHVQLIYATPSASRYDERSARHRSVEEICLSLEQQKDTSWQQKERAAGTCQADLSPRRTNHLACSSGGGNNLSVDFHVASQSGRAHWSRSVIRDRRHHFLKSQPHRSSRAHSAAPRTLCQR